MDHVIGKPKISLNQKIIMILLYFMMFFLGDTLLTQSEDFI